MRCVTLRPAAASPCVFRAAPTAAQCCRCRTAVTASPLRTSRGSPSASTAFPPVARANPAAPGSALRSSSTCCSCTRRGSGSRARSGAAVPSPAISAPNACMRAPRTKPEPHVAKTRHAPSADQRPAKFPAAAIATMAEPMLVGADATEDPLRDPTLYLNRELSQLDFNFRVLAQAQDESMPMLERLRYLCISCTNLDEFFEIRAATVRHAHEFGMPPAADGLPAATVLRRIHAAAADLVQGQYDCWNRELRPALNAAGVRILPRDAWSDAQDAWLRGHFRDEILPVLSPLGLDPAHPFPKILNKSLNIVVALEGRDAFGRAGHLAIVRAPRSLPRIIQLPEEVSGGPHDFVFLSAVLAAYVDELFPGMQVQGAYQFRVTRNSELTLDEEVENLAHAVRDELVGRGYLRAMRLEIAEACPEPIVRMLLRNFELPAHAVYRIDGPVNLNRVMQV